MENMKKQLLLPLLLLFLTQSVAQNIISSQIPTQSQLPIGDIIRTFQDSEGYIWYGTTKGGLYRDDGYTVKAFRSDVKTPNLMESNHITCMTEDNERQIWFGTKRGVYILDKKKYAVRPFEDEDLKGRVIIAANAVSDGTIWISTEKTLYKYNPRGERIGMYMLTWEGESKSVSSIFEDDAHTVWVILWRGGILRYDQKQDQFIPYPWTFPEKPSFILKTTTNPYYWIGTWGNGIVRFDPNEKDPEKMYVLQTATVKDAGKQKKHIGGIVQDSVRHHLWVTTMDDLYEYEITEENNLKPVDTSGFLPTGKKIIHSARSDRSGNLWVTSHYPHSFILSFRSDDIIYHEMPQAKEKLGFPVTPMQLIYDNGYYWFWQMSMNLCFYQMAEEICSVYKTQNLLSFFEKSRSMDGVYAIKNSTRVVLLQADGDKMKESSICKLPKKDHERIRMLHEDKKGNLWIGTTFDLLCYNLKTKTFERVWEDIGIVNHIISLDDGSVCIATESNGFLKLSPEREKKRYDSDRNDNYLRMCLTPDQNIWLRTQQGCIYYYDSTTDTFSLKTIEYDLSNEIIYDASCDSEGNLWVLTDQKIIVYDPLEHTSHLIRCSDPSIHLENFLAIYKDEEGKMHVGGSGGVLVFSSYKKPAQPVDDSPISLTDIKVNGVTRTPGYDEKEIILQPNERNLELFFSTFDPMNKDKIRFAFRYKGQNSYWNYLPEKQNNIYLSELAKGNYELEIKATDKNGIWSKEITSVSIQRLPAWYETWVAYIAYTLLVLFITYLIIARYIRYQKRQHRIELEDQISQLKYRFFTNVSHELRTPLTLIITPLETVIKKVTEPSIRKQLELISRNAQGLLSLVNQLLDFRKIEMGGEVLSLVKGDIDRFLFSIYENFQLMTDEKGLHFIYESELSSFYCFYDHDKLRKMVNNLLINAIKFTKENGSILLTVREEKKENRSFVVISVEDTGEGISEDQLPRIFERFHQVDVKGSSAGSGIGLHLVKEYAAMHQGSVSVRSELNKGSVFTIYIPTDLVPEHSLPSGEVTEDMPDDNPSRLSDDQTKKVLIVEDNAEFRLYMKNELEHYYIVYEASNGKEGEQKAIELAPDIIITDLMMPEMDGIELCRQVKNNIEISHIPIILLTANDNIENEKRGYKEGADAYIGKPFHWDILLSRIQNLMEQKMQRQQAFEKNIEISPRNITISSLDERLIEKALGLIEKNLSNSEYSIEDLSMDMGMSRVSLYRKISSITGNSPTEFVKNIRLRRAAELLREGNYTVSEVAYKVGFSTPGYFTQSFKKTFGVLPTHFK